MLDISNRLSLCNQLLKEAAGKSEKHEDYYSPDPSGGLNLTFSLEREWLERTFAEFGDELVGVTPVETACRVNKMGATVLVQGSLATKLKLPCARCLELAEIDVATDFRYVLVPQPTGFRPEVALREDEIEYGYYTDDRIDLLPLLYEQVCLQLPMVVLCREDCLGICPHCGHNRNYGPCHCEDNVRDERWSALKHVVIVQK